ncbi:hypothetical protein OG337_28985 [[Kitasatospora] papulosa]|uniref:hypothetical protein n=1 Tax=[Kitasatospora] papulosa TaxID=1464011 RepID=UPI0038695A93|nr:hypothetical protein OG337_28985 [[Kitasatospora] papulosa]
MTTTPMTPEQRKAIAVQIGDVQPATDALSMRGSLSPNGEASKVPFELGPTLTPAVDWLINRVAELEATLADATEPDVDGAGRTYQEYNPGSRDLHPGAEAARRMLRNRQDAEETP